MGLVGLVASSLVLAGCGGSAESAAGDLHGTRLDPPFPVASTPLTGTDGQPFSLTKDTDKPLTLVFFGYTHCPDVCPTTLNALARAIETIGSGNGADPMVLFVGVDVGGPVRLAGGILGRSKMTSSAVRDP